MTVQLTPGAKRHLLDASPSGDEPWYINDHTLIRDESGTWHVFGIWHPEPAAPLDETFFLHATTDTLPDGTWTVHDPVMHARTGLGETHVWAPHVIRHDGRYWMFYCGGTEDHTRYRMELATSDDLFTWVHHPGGPLFEDGFDARDPMVIRDAERDRWLLYYTKTETIDGGHHEVGVRTSEDLITWSEPSVAYRSEQTGTYGGPTESPFVVQVGEQWVLFVCESGIYDCTLAYASDDPMRFTDAGRIDVTLNEHCAEIVEDPASERTWITGGGWGRGGLSIRELGIEERATGDQGAAAGD